MEVLELYLPDLEGEFALETDASEIGLGAVLKKGNKIVAHASRSLSPTEQRYSITEKEVLAAIWGMEKFCYYLAGKKFILVTDHEAILKINNKRDFGKPRVQRWHTRLYNFNSKIIHRAGNELF